MALISSPPDRPRSALVLARSERVDALTDAVRRAGMNGRGVRDLADLQMVAVRFPPDLVLLDGGLDDPRALLARVRDAAPETPVAIVVTSADAAGLTSAITAGADAVLPWPVDAAALRRLAAIGPAPAEATDPNRDMAQTLIGSGEHMRELWTATMTAAPSRAPVLITGETGVGKEVVARALHRLSGRRGQFIAVNCAALPETLLEAELFGHERGAFTGATQQKKGRFELAERGTLFLDEIGDLPLPMQVKLLRVLQERSFERLGGSDTLPVDARIIAATHRDLEADCASGRFRLDLFYRLNVLELRIPPLRARQGDVLELWHHFVRTFSAEEGRDPPDTTAAAQARLLRHDWPGNVRELQNAAQHALTVTRGQTIDEDDLPPRLSNAQPSSGPLDLVGMTMKEIERRAIEQTYSALGTVEATAEALGISERTLYSRLRDYRRAEEPGLPADSATVDASSPQLLLAEDDDDVRAALKSFLTSEGYNVVAVADGRAALNHIDRAKQRGRAGPDVLVTDVRMPRASGLELMEGVRALGLQVPVIVMSAFGDRGTRERAIALGASVFLEKPIAIAALQRALSRLGQ